MVRRPIDALKTLEDLVQLDPTLPEISLLRAKQEMLLGVDGDKTIDYLTEYYVEKHLQTYERYANIHFTVRDIKESLDLSNDLFSDLFYDKIEKHQYADAVNLLSETTDGLYRDIITSNSGCLPGFYVSFLKHADDLYTDCMKTMGRIPKSAEDGTVARVLNNIDSLEINYYDWEEDLLFYPELKNLYYLIDEDQEDIVIFDQGSFFQSLFVDKCGVSLMDVTCDGLKHYMMEPESADENVGLAISKMIGFEKYNLSDTKRLYEILKECLADVGKKPSDLDEFPGWGHHGRTFSSFFLESKVNYALANVDDEDRCDSGTFYDQGSAELRAIHNREAKTIEKKGFFGTKIVKEDFDLREFDMAQVRVAEYVRYYESGHTLCYDSVLFFPELSESGDFNGPQVVPALYLLYD